MQCSASEEAQTDGPNSLFLRAQAGDQAAWTSLFYQCFPKVRRYVGRKLGSRVRRIVDSSDIANLVMLQLALKVREYKFDSIEEVQNFLISVASDLVNDEYRRRNALKRDMTREQPMYGRDEEFEFKLSSNEPTPSQVAVAKETEDKILNHETLDDEEKFIIRRRVENYEVKEIAVEGGLSVQKIQRFLRRLRQTYDN